MRLVVPDLTRADWLFELVLDYGVHNPDAPTPRDEHSWACRSNLFAGYRAGFEVRIYWLYCRALMFHPCRDESHMARDCLMRSTGSYVARLLPPMMFGYS
ncbi:MAG: hypothetical protein OHK0022_10870 [Roseiflexaceae bacterium]